jgi:hypothetical protein
VLPVEVTLQNLWITREDYLSAKESTKLMVDKINEAPKSPLKAYNEHVVGILFQVGDLVWKMILPLQNQSGMFDKWSHSWEGQLSVIRVVPGNAYFVEDLEGRSLSKALNGKYLKCYYPSKWQDR